MKEIGIFLTIFLGVFLILFLNSSKTAVAAYDFSVSATPTSDIAVPGDSVTTTINVRRNGSGARETVNLSVLCPSNIDCSLSRTLGQVSYTSTLTITTTNSTPEGVYTIGITGNGTIGNLTRTESYTLIIAKNITVCPTQPTSYPTDFWDRVWCNANFTTRLGDSQDEPNLEFDNNYGFGQVAGIRADDIGFRSGRTLNLTETGLYNFSVGSDYGIKVWIDGNSVFDKVEQNYTVESFNQTLNAGIHQFRIDYYHIANSSEVSFSFMTPSQLPFDYSIIAPSSITVLPNTSTNFSINVVLTQGTAAQVTLAVVCPSGMTCTFIPKTVTPPNTSMLQIVTTNSTSLGTYPINITATSGGLQKNTTSSLTVSLTQPSSLPSFITDNAMWILIGVFAVVVLVFVYKTVIVGRSKK